MSGATSTGTSGKELRGSVLDVIGALHDGGKRPELLAVVAKLVARNAELERLVSKLRDSKNRGEHISPDQLDLFLDRLREAMGGELAEADAKLAEAAQENGERPEKTKPPKQPARRRPLPPGARRVDNPIPVPPEERPCPRCGKERTCIGHETTEIVDLIPPEVIVRLDHREVLACKDCEAELVEAPLGDKVIAGGAYGSMLVADLVVGKYWDGLPLNRLSDGFERLGLSMPSSSMADQITWATDLLRPIWWKLGDGVLGAKIMHLDGTSLPVRDQDSPRGIVTGSLWGYVGVSPGADAQAVYLYTSTGKKVGQREGEVGPEDFLRRRQGYTVADASSLFDLSFLRPELVEIACNMHARRYFVKALDAGDLRASVPMKAFQALYAVEEAVRGATEDTVLAERQKRSRPVYEELASWCRTHRPVEPPSSLLGKAVGYLLNHHVALTRFLDDGAVPIDNGVVERLHRRPAMGRRSFLFAGSHAGAERAAIAYSVLASCDLAGVNQKEYLADVLPRLNREALSVARDIPPLLPAAWKRARRLAIAPSTSTRRHSCWPRAPRRGDGDPPGSSANVWPRGVPAGG